MSHARRFGKSQITGLIDAYYSVGADSRELLKPYEIYQSDNFAAHLNKYYVIHLDMASFSDNAGDGVLRRVESYLHEELEEEFPHIETASYTISKAVLTIYKNTKIKFVIVVDEWDCIIRNHSQNQQLVHEYLQFLHSLFKSEESKHFLALGYITGILPIKKIQNESALNNFEEYTMTSSKLFTKYFGFTEDEVKTLCNQYAMDFEQMKEWYNGYRISGFNMYNPNSVVSALMNHEVDSYWKNTSSFETINNYIMLDYEGLREDILELIVGKRIKVNVKTFQNDLSYIRSKDEALTALIHLGYLGYDEKNHETYMPNYEVKTAYEAALAVGQWENVAKLVMRCDDLLSYTIEKNADKIAELIELAHETYTSVLKYNDENALSSVISLAYFTAPAYYNVIREFPSGKGFADIVFIPRKYAGNRSAMVVELKWDVSADTAIRQIKEKRYTGALQDYADHMLLVDISYDKETKKHRCVIEG